MPLRSLLLIIGCSLANTAALQLFVARGNAATVQSPLTPLPSGARNEAQVMKRKAFPTFAVGKDTWAVDDIGKRGVPHLNSRELRLARWAYRITPYCMRWRLRFAFPALSDGAKEHAFVLFTGGPIYFSKNQFVVPEFFDLDSGTRTNAM